MTKTVKAINFFTWCSPRSATLSRRASTFSVNQPQETSALRILSARARYSSICQGRGNLPLRSHGIVDIATSRVTSKPGSPLIVASETRVSNSSQTVRVKRPRAVWASGPDKRARLLKFVPGSRTARKMGTGSNFAAFAKLRACTYFA